jgi:hypothetical protein
MIRRLVLLGVAALVGCGRSAAEPSAALGATKVATADAFAGSWNSVTPSYDFIRLSVVSKSSEQGALGARLTLSGLAFEGNARIDADSLIATLSVVGSTQSTATLIGRVADANTLVANFRSADGVPLALRFVRQ